MKSYNQSLNENNSYEPYTDDEIEEIKETEIINSIRFKRLLATIEKLNREKEEIKIQAWNAGVCFG
ncbi:hypothetical protein [Clostridium sp. YIM B02500]|uniref:hypothetical protein n=1 Tax=Clostridium sp. YIM B02500 TaxID=2910681 RepID=UPI001EED1CAE|nr:hypothetical protein [Clostridium sp. YIM B02500]